MDININIKAETDEDAMDAIWQIWEALSKGHQPLSGNGPEPSHPNGFRYEVKFDGDYTKFQTRPYQFLN